MTTVNVTITVDVDGPMTRQGLPKTLSWQHQHITGDNGRFYGDAIVKAIMRAAQQAAGSAEAFRDLSDPVPGQPVATSTFLDKHGK